MDFYYSNGKKIAIKKLPNKKQIREKSPNSVFNNKSKITKFLDGINEINTVVDLKQSEWLIEGDNIEKINLHFLNEHLVDIDDADFQFGNVYLDKESKSELILTDEIIIQFNKNANPEYITHLLEKYNCTIKENLEDRVFLLEIGNLFDSDENALKIANTLYEEPIVIFAQPNFEQELKFSESFPDSILFQEQWYLHDAQKHFADKKSDINILPAWDLAGYGNQDIRIAFIDDGFDIEHPDLKINVIPSLCYNTIDNSKNVLPRKNYHGTACAGIASASIRSDGMVGVAPSCSFFGVEIYGKTSIKTIGKALKYAAKHADVISCSWEINESDYIRKILKDIAIKNGNYRASTCVFAVGNSGGNRISFPARMDEVIGVGAFTYNLEHASYSNKGEGLDLVAPSSISLNKGEFQRIFTTDPKGNYGKIRNEPRFKGDYLFENHGFGGTSAATPQVAGVIALMLSINPLLDFQKIKEALTTSTDLIGNINEYDEDGWSNKYGYGRINAGSAIERTQSFIT